ncbi:MAG: hypothetical protein QM820_13450 [Minicystis sp.]
MLTSPPPELMARRAPNLVQKEPPLLGVATWNVAHFGSTNADDMKLDELYWRVKDGLAAARAETYDIVREFPEMGEEDAYEEGRDGYFGAKKSQKPGGAEEEEEDDDEEDDDDDEDYDGSKLYAHFERRLAKIDKKLAHAEALAQRCGWKPSDQRPTYTRTKAHKWLDPNPQVPRKLRDAASDKASQSRDYRANRYYTAALSLDAILRSTEAKVSSLRGNLKRRAVVACISELFEKNPWLDVLVLQEVNSAQAFEELLAKCKLAKALACHRGPELQSSGGKKQRRGKKKSGIQNRVLPRGDPDVGVGHAHEPLVEQALRPGPGREVAGRRPFHLEQARRSPALPAHRRPSAPARRRAVRQRRDRPHDARLRGRSEERPRVRPHQRVRAAREGLHGDLDAGEQRRVVDHRRRLLPDARGAGDEPLPPRRGGDSVSPSGARLPRAEEARGGRGGPEARGEDRRIERGERRRRDARWRRPGRGLQRRGDARGHHTRGDASGHHHR